MAKKRDRNASSTSCVVDVALGADEAEADAEADDGSIKPKPHVEFAKKALKASIASLLGASLNCSFW